MSSSRDQFVRQPTAPLQRTPTRPVGGEVALYAQLEDAMGRAGPLLEGAAGPIAALHEACRRAGVRPPGVPDEPPARRLTPAEDAAAAAIAAAVKVDLALQRRVAVAVFRWHDARAAVAQAASASERRALAPPVIERLRQTLYYVSVYHMEFKADDLVRPLFPGPRTHGAGGDQLSQIQKLKRKLAQEAALEAAKELADGLDAPMAVGRDVLAMIDGTKALGFKGLLDAQARQARLISLTIGQDAEAVARLRKGLKDHDALRAALARARNHEDAPKVEAAAFPLSGFEHACRQHAGLKMIFPAPKS